MIIADVINKNSNNKNKKKNKNNKNKNNTVKNNENSCIYSKTEHAMHETNSARFVA